jgi:hypothetical protein
MITNKVSIILDDKNIHYALICKVINIVKNKYNKKFNTDDLISIDEFSVKEKEYLRKIFLPHVSGLYAWEHNFYFHENLWHYDESDQYDYQETIRQIMRLLNNGKIAIGEKIHTTDYELIRNIYYDWFSLLESEAQRLYAMNFNEREFIIFISHNLKSRLGETCIFNFEFLKTFMEAKKDYHAKNVIDAMWGVEKI